MSDNLTAGCDFDFHGHALDNIFDTYKELRNRCPVGRSEEHGGFWFLMKSEDIFAAEQSPDTFSVTPSMLLPPFGTDMPLIPIDIDPPEHTQYRRVLLPLFTPQAVAKLDEGMHRTARELATEVAAHDVSTFRPGLPGRCRPSSSAGWPVSRRRTGRNSTAGWTTSSTSARSTLSERGKPAVR